MEQERLSAKNLSILQRQYLMSIADGVILDKGYKVVKVKEDEDFTAPWRPENIDPIFKVKYLKDMVPGEDPFIKDVVLRFSQYRMVYSSRRHDFIDTLKGQELDKTFSDREAGISSFWWNLDSQGLVLGQRRKGIFSKEYIPDPGAIYRYITLEGIKGTINKHVVLAHNTLSSSNVTSKSPPHAQLAIPFARKEINGAYQFFQLALQNSKQIALDDLLNHYTLDEKVRDNFSKENPFA